MTTIAQKIEEKIRKKGNAQERFILAVEKYNEKEKQMVQLKNELLRLENEKHQIECESLDYDNELNILFRAESLKKLNDYILNEIQNEDLIVNYWFATGIPDQPVELDFYNIANDKELFSDCIKTFVRILELEEKSNWI